MRAIHQADRARVYNGSHQRSRQFEHDSTEENLRTFGGWLQRYGRPLAHYTDKNSIFRHRRGAAALQEQLRGEEALSQFGRALRELGIEWIAATVPRQRDASSGCLAPCKIPCASRTPLEETLEADISTWRKPGHFYFALTRTQSTNQSRAVFFE